MIRQLIRQLDPSWQTALSDFPNREAILDGLDNILQRDQGHYNPQRDNSNPPRERIFAALEATPFDKVRVVIIGQDPYPNSNFATGLAFFANENMPDSLRNIYNAIENDLGRRPRNDSLKRWAEEEGVLLLNRVLTLLNDRNGDNTHKNQGWEEFTGAVIKALTNDSTRRLHFILWGKDAEGIKDYIDGDCYHIHKAPHPKAYYPENLVEAFRTCRHFSAVNHILIARGEPAINWLP